MTEDISPAVKSFDSNYIIQNNINPTLNIALFVGEFEKGTINKPYLITDVLQFKLIFGRATDSNYNSWYQVYNYLTYAGSPKIWVCRTAGTLRANSSLNGISSTSPGEWGNLLTVEITHKNNTNNYLLSTFSMYSESEMTEDYFVIIKRKEQIVETFTMSEPTELKSVYIEAITLEEGIFKLEGGFCEEAAAPSYKETFEIFTKEDYEIDIVIGAEDYNDVVIEFVESRKDCVGFLGVPRRFLEFILGNDKILTTENGIIIVLSLETLNYKLSNTDYDKIKKYINDLNKSAYCFCCFGFKIEIDGFTGNRKIINAIGDIAGLKAKASTINPWSIGVGVEKGKITNFKDITLKCSKEQSDELYKLGVNVLQNDTLMSQKMFVNEKSKVDRLHQRNIFNYLERASEKLMRKYMFNDNSRILRSILATELKLLLEDMMTSNGIEAGKVVVTSDIANSIIINIYIKMTYMTEFIKLGLINTGTDSVSLIADLQIKEK